MPPRSLSDDLLEILVERLADRLADILAERLKPSPAADLSRVVDRLEWMLRSRGTMAPVTAVETGGGEADRKWGFRFAVDGVLGTDESRSLMGGCSERTLNRHVIAGKIRRGKDGRRAVYCNRSVMQYLAGLEE